MLRIAVCDDVPKDLEVTKGLLEEYREARPDLEITISGYDSPYRLLTEFEAGRWHDVYLLDILMPGVDGIRLGRTLRQCNESCSILFGTITPEYALESFSAGAQNYLLKPFRRDALFQALDRAVGHMDVGQACGISVRSERGVHFLPYHEILYVESRDRSMVFHLTGGREVVSLKLRSSFEAALAGPLTDPRFCQPHKSFVVNLEHVRLQGGGRLELVGGVSLPVPAGRRRALMDLYLNYAAGHR